MDNFIFWQLFKTRLEASFETYAWNLPTREVHRHEVIGRHY